MRTPRPIAERPRAGSPPVAVARALGVLGLTALVALIYAHAGQFGFVGFDDGAYVADNPVVRGGLTWHGVAWAFTSTTAANWHPVTMLSLMADVSLFGADPGWLHLANVAWHLVNAVLLWVVLEAATGARWRSWIVAAHFAVLPLHVESVAWISERKDLLSTCFWLASIGAWLGFLKKRSRGRYALVIAAFTLGLMSKPMVVTLPVVLLVLDFWPLERLELGPGIWSRLRPLVIEKLPLFALSAAAGVVTIATQHQSGATATAEAVPYSARVGNAFLATASYLYKTFWPQGLAVFYPNPAARPGGLPMIWVVSSAALVIGLSAVALWQRRSRPYLLSGWLWFLVTLLPVIGLVQVGRQGMADRYTYIPLIGISVALVWLVPRAWTATAAGRAAVIAGAGAVLLALAVVARAQAAHWRDSFSLFQHAAQVTEANWLAWKNLGAIHHERGESQQAIEAFQNAARAMPDDADIWFDLGLELETLERHADAAECFRRAVLLAPDDAEAWFHLGVTSALLRRAANASEAVERLGRIDAARSRELDALVVRIARQLDGEPSPERR